ncbi:MAG: nucleotide exchange factor GrpE [Nitrospirae bacterium]|nr:MAG: nucleotide exchange factor GrpE [Nitrospirota bacterium]
MEEKEMRDVEEKKEFPPEEKKEELPSEPLKEEKTLEEKLSELEKELEEQKEKYIRLYAEFDNYRKRVQKEKEELVKYSVEPLIGDLLTVLDNLEMALEHASKESDPKSLIEGVELTLREFKKVIYNYGVEEIEALGKPFDPTVHHAMSQIERPDVEHNTVVEEYRKGYKLKDRVMRPSLVAVSKKVESEVQQEDISDTKTDRQADDTGDDTQSG